MSEQGEWLEALPQNLLSGRTSWWTNLQAGDA
jgi:hypothetical protein